MAPMDISFRAEIAILSKLSFTLLYLLLSSKCAAIYDATEALGF